MEPFRAGFCSSLSSRRVSFNSFLWLGTLAKLLNMRQNSLDVQRFVNKITKGVSQSHFLAPKHHGLITEDSCQRVLPKSLASCSIGGRVHGDLPKVLYQKKLREPTAL